MSREATWTELEMIARSDETHDEAQIRAAIDDEARAIPAKDADSVMSHHAPGSVTFDLAPPLVSGGVDAKGLQVWFATWQGLLHLGSRRCRLLPRLAWSCGTKTDGEKADLWFRQTLGFRKIRDDWMIAHQHESVPFYMDGSCRAAVDLAP
jgi:PhnB protein